jgi:hypothetical protein
MEKKRWKDLSTTQRGVILTLASVQISLAVSAWTDLALRKPELVRGSKLKWAGIIAINFVGPVLYFTRGKTAP